MLHTFANHELLAMELMAVALLRFPDAPSAWRLGLGRILLEEQEHMRLYLGRMKELGVRFGELPVSPFFWRCLSPMKTPMDFAAGMSLCLEQANLDWCRVYSAAVRGVGDEQTEALLERVYRDEIGHVAHGLRWFRRWKDPQASDWEAFVSALGEPLSPARARGRTLDLEGRRRAGFDEDFIQRIGVYARSRGRQPWVYSFEPGVEALAAGRPLGKAALGLQRDLAALPHLLASADDIVLAPPQRPAFLARLKEAGLTVPEFTLELADRKVAGHRPFAVPGEHLRRSHVASLREDLAVCSSMDEVERAARRWPDVVLKAEYSSSGQGHRWGWNETARRWAERRLREDGLVLVEPVLDIEVELSALWHLGRFQGFARPIVEGGVWRGHRLGPVLEGCAGDVHRFVFEGRRLERELRALELPETCGLDLAILRSEEGLSLRILERNARTTMGHYALALRRRLGPGGCFRVVRLDQIPSGALCLTDPETATTWCAVVDFNPELR